MSITAQEIPADLMSHDESLRRLAEEHSRCEQQLQQLSRQPYLNSEDLLLEVQLKKTKLRLKDRMQLIVARHRRAGH